MLNSNDCHWVKYFVWENYFRRYCRRKFDCCVAKVRLNLPWETSPALQSAPAWRRRAAAPPSAGGRPPRGASAPAESARAAARPRLVLRTSETAVFICTGSQWCLQFVLDRQLGITSLEKVSSGLPDTKVGKTLCLVGHWGLEYVSLWILIHCSTARWLLLVF